MRDWISGGVVFGCTLLTAAMFGVVGITPTDATVKMAEWSANRAERAAKESKETTGIALEESRDSAAAIAELVMQVNRLEKKIAALENDDSR